MLFVVAVVSGEPVVVVMPVPDVAVDTECVEPGINAWGSSRSWICEPGPADRRPSRWMPEVTLIVPLGIRSNLRRLIALITGVPIPVRLLVVPLVA